LKNYTVVPFKTTVNLGFFNFWNPSCSPTLFPPLFLFWVFGSKKNRQIGVFLPYGQIKGTKATPFFFSLSEAFQVRNELNSMPLFQARKIRVGERITLSEHEIKILALKRAQEIFQERVEKHWLDFFYFFTISTIPSK